MEKLCSVLEIFNFLPICDLLREKGPTAIKRRFKTQLNAISIWMLCNIPTSTS